MGEMAATARDFVVVTRFSEHRLWLESQFPEDRSSVVISGRVFFDHVKGLRALPESAPNGYALIQYWYDYDWMQQHAVQVIRFADVNELLNKAEQDLTAARTSPTNSNYELSELYAIVVD